MQTLPSGRAPAPGEPAALVLAPFRGVRYCPGRVSGLAEVTSPPYDVIGAEAVARLLGEDPRNVVRLIVPQLDPERPGADYQDAVGTLRDWLASGVLAPDPEPALYAYEQASADGQVLQRGLIGGIKLTPPGAAVVLPHEDVMPGPVAGRLRLMEATSANLEPIFLLYDGAGGAATRLLDEIATTRPPAVDITTEDSLTHRLWPVTGEAELAAIAADLAPRHAVIADGHHRYAAYLQLQSRRRADGAGAGPWDYGLALLVDSTAYPPRIDAIHRVIPGLPLDEAVTAARKAFRVRPVHGELGDGLAALADAGRSGAAYLLGDGAALYMLTDPDLAQVAGSMPAGRSARWQALPAAILQQLLMGGLWGIADDERAVRVIHHDAARAVRAASRAGGTAVISNPLTADDVRAVAAAGERVPRKSTSFGPKPRTGLVMRTFAEG